MARKIFAESDTSLLESLFETKKLKPGATVKDLKSMPAHASFSCDFPNSTFHRHMKNIAQKVAINGGSKRE